MVSAGMDLEKPRPLQVLVGVRTSVTTGFFNIAARVRAVQRKLTYTACVCLTFKLVTLDPQTLWQPWPFIYVAARLYFGLNYGLTLGATNDSVWSDPYLWLPTVFSVRSQMPEKVSKFVVSLFK